MWKKVLAILEPIPSCLQRFMHSPSVLGNGNAVLVTEKVNCFFLSILRLMRDLSAVFCHFLQMSLRYWTSSWRVNSLSSDTSVFGMNPHIQKGSVPSRGHSEPVLCQWIHKIHGTFWKWEHAREVSATESGRNSLQLLTISSQLERRIPRQHAFMQSSILPVSEKNYIPHQLPTCFRLRWLRSVLCGPWFSVWCRFLREFWRCGA